MSRRLIVPPIVPASEIIEASLLPGGSLSGALFWRGKSFAPYEVPDEWLEHSERSVADERTFEAWVRAGGGRTLIEFVQGVA